MGVVKETKWKKKFLENSSEKGNATIGKYNDSMTMESEAFKPCSGHASNNLKYLPVQLLSMS